MPVAPTTARAIAAHLEDREFAIAVELTAEMERILNTHDCPDATSIIHAELVGALRRVTVRMGALSHCDCNHGLHHAAWCKSRPNPQRRSTLDECFSGVPL